MDPSPSPSPTAFDDSALRAVGVDPENLPIWSLQGWYLFFYIIATAIAVLILRAVYRGMQRPRLELTFHSQDPPTVTGAAVLRYLVTPLFLIPSWFTVILIILVLAAGRGSGIRPGNELVIATAVVVGASRLLAYINREGAHELAKSVPLTLLSLILISGQVITVQGALSLTVLLIVNFDSLLYYVILLGLWDVMFTFGWLLWRRLRWEPDGGRPEGPPKTTIARLWDAIAHGWGARESGPAPMQRPEAP